MPRDADFTPDPACMIIIKDDDLYIMSSLWSAYGGGHAYHEVLAKHSLEEFLATPREVGRAIRAAWKQFYIVPREEDEPGDTLDALKRKLRGRSLRGARSVSIWRDSATSTIRFSGSFAFAAWGFENLNKCKVEVPAKLSDETVGQTLVDLLKKMKRRVWTWPA